MTYSPVEKILKFSPIKEIDFGSFILKIFLFDGSLTTNYLLKIEINEPPYFTNKISD
jgi:hypothetical protein